jgi:hypothetical protein
MAKTDLLGIMQDHEDQRIFAETRRLVGCDEWGCSLTITIDPFGWWVRHNGKREFVSSRDIRHGDRYGQWLRDYLYQQPPHNNGEEVSP